MLFNSALSEAGVAPETVAIILHKTNLPRFRQVLPWLVENRPDLFDAYQSVHSDSATSTLRRRDHAASFVPNGSGTLVFAGLYCKIAAELVPTAELYSDPRFVELERDYGAVDTAPTRHIAERQEQYRFGFRLCPELSDLRGRLVIKSPPGRTYTRLAERLDAEIFALLPEPVFSAPVPDWRDLVLSAAEVRLLPASWRAWLSEWRGIYLILDETDGGRYVGSAYGEANIYGRWRAHVSGEQGVTAELGHRKTSALRFSLLERLGPDTSMEDVVARETQWKKRLHTIEFGLNRQ